MLQSFWSALNSYSVFSLFIWVVLSFFYDDMSSLPGVCCHLDSSSLLPSSWVAWLMSHVLPASVVLALTSFTWWVLVVYCFSNCCHFFHYCCCVISAVLCCCVCKLLQWLHVIYIGSCMVFGIGCSLLEIVEKSPCI